MAGPKITCYLDGKQYLEAEDATFPGAGMIGLSLAISLRKQGLRVLIVERLIPNDPHTAVPVLLSDLNMLVFSGGQERTNAEYDELLTAARLNLTKVQPVASPYGVIEGLAP